jgi:erythromycin esterase-like protein
MHTPLIKCLTLLLALATTARADDDGAAAAVVQWIKSTAIPLKTAEAGNGFDDMRPIKSLVGGARIVSLGESTHGTREIFQMKHRMLEYLVRECGFTLFGIEASLPDCIAINDYVLNGKTDPERAVAGQGFWTWSTEEVLALVKWMRAYNEDPANSGKPKLKFFGFDMQQEASAVNAAMVYLARVDPEAASKFRPRVQGVFERRPMAGQMPPDEVKQLREAMEEVGKRFDANASAYTATTSPDEFAIARRCVTVCLQALELVEESRRQSSSIGQIAEMQLYQVVSADAKALLEYLQTNDAELAKSSRELLESLSDLTKFSRAYYDDGTTDAQRGAWKRQADQVKDGVAGADGEAKKRADHVVTLLKVMDEYRAKGQNNTVENVRDRCMAENIAWILEHEAPQSKIVCWSHNGHAFMPSPKPGEGALAMGSYLERKFGDDHLVIGFSFNRGAFQAVGGPRSGKMGLSEWTVGPAKAGSLDETFAKAGIPIFLLDLRHAPDGPVKDWLKQPHPMRMAGAIFDPSVENTNYYSPTTLVPWYDAMIFIDETTRARPLRTAPHSSMDPASVAQAKRPRLGVQLRQAEPGTKGLLIDGVLADQSAARAGIKQGDRLLKIGDVEVSELPQIRQIMSKHENGDVVPVTIERDGSEQVIDVKLTGGMK